MALDIRKPSEVTDDDSIVAVVSVRFGQCYDYEFWDAGYGPLWLWSESLGPRGVVRATNWENAYECVIDELMDDAECQCSDSWRVRKTEDKTAYLAGNHVDTWTTKAQAYKFYSLAQAQDAAQRKERNSGTPCTVTRVHRIDEFCPFHGAHTEDESQGLPDGIHYRSSGVPSNPRLKSYLASEDLHGSHLERLEDCPEFDREFYIIVEDNNA
jgi:hypothetical protein